MLVDGGGPTTCESVAELLSKFMLPEKVAVNAYVPGARLAPGE